MDNKNHIHGEEPKTRWRLIGPQFAKRVLLKNENRNVRETHVRSIYETMMRGEWRKTHQGIAFDEDGYLLDGQHRMMALARMPEGFLIEMLVTTGLPRSHAWDAIDINGLKRTVADVLGCNRKVTAIAAIFDIVMTATKAHTPSALSVYVEYFNLETDALFRHCGTIRKVWSSASVQAAAVFSMKLKPSSWEYVLGQYAALVSADYRSMSDIVQSLHRSVETGSRKQKSRMDLFARCTKAFDVDNEAMSRVQIREVAKTVREVREQMLQWLPKLRREAERCSEVESRTREGS